MLTFWTYTNADFFGLTRMLCQDTPDQVAGLVTYKIDLLVLSDTNVSVSILFLVLVDLINCKGGHP